MACGCYFLLYYMFEEKSGNNFHSCLRCWSKLLFVFTSVCPLCFYSPLQGKLTGILFILISILKTEHTGGFETKENKTSFIVCSIYNILQAHVDFSGAWNIEHWKSGKCLAEWGWLCFKDGRTTFFRKNCSSSAN